MQNVFRLREISTCYNTNTFLNSYLYISDCLPLMSAIFFLFFILNYIKTFTKVKIMFKQYFSIFFIKFRYLVPQTWARI